MSVRGGGGSGERSWRSLNWRRDVVRGGGGLSRLGQETIGGEVCAGGEDDEA